MKFELNRDQIACIRHALIVDRNAADAKANAAVTTDPSPQALAEAYRYAVLCTSTLQVFDAQLAAATERTPPPIAAEAHRAARETRRADMRLCGAVGTEPCRWSGLAGAGPGRCSECARRG